jgi:hypothetical protein
MSIDSLTVAVIVGVVSEQRIYELAQRMPVWVAERLVSEQSIAKIRAATHHSVTTFDVHRGEAPGATVGRVLLEIDEHHGEVSQEKPYQRVEVVGAELSELLKNSMRSLGFLRFDRTDDGFVAHKGS